MWNKKHIMSTVAIALVGCASMPSGPRVTVMPAPGKSFELFVQEDNICRQFAAQSIGNSAQDSGNQAFAAAAVGGAALGAVAGELMGGRHDGASSGAGMGLLMGSMIGTDASNSSASDAQHRYDIAYQQCMYAKGNQLPGQHYGAPPPAYSAPPPPPPRG